MWGLIPSLIFSNASTFASGKVWAQFQAGNVDTTQMVISHSLIIEEFGCYEKHEYFVNCIMIYWWKKKKNKF